MTALIWVLGLSYLVSGVLSTATAARAYRKREIWTWYAFWVVPVFYIRDIINNPSISGSAWTIDAIGLAAMLITLISPRSETILHHKKGLIAN